MRCFLALDLADAIRRDLVDAIQRLRGAGDVTWVAPAALHLTLVFLGELDDVQVSRAQAVLAGAPLAALALGLDGLGTFPARGTPRVVWAGLGGDTAALLALQADFAAALASIAPADGRAFHAHVTLGRCKSRLGGGALWRRCRELSPSLHSAPVAVPSVTLYRSELRPQGPVHTALLSRPLPHQR